MFTVLVLRPASLSNKRYLNAKPSPTDLAEPCSFVRHPQIPPQHKRHHTSGVRVAYNEDTPFIEVPPTRNDDRECELVCLDTYRKTFKTSEHPSTKIPRTLVLNDHICKQQNKQAFKISKTKSSSRARVRARATFPNLQRTRRKAGEVADALSSMQLDSPHVAAIRLILTLNDGEDEPMYSHVDDVVAGGHTSYYASVAITEETSLNMSILIMKG